MEGSGTAAALQLPMRQRDIAQDCAVRRLQGSCALRQVQATAIGFADVWGAIVLGVCIGGAWLCGGCVSYDPLESQRGCDAYGLGTCQAYARCSPAFVAQYGSLESCQSQLSASCVYSLAQPDVLGSGAGVQACGEALSEIDCNVLLNGELPLRCQAPAGRRGDGSPCAVGSQCASTRCKRLAADDARGTCEELATWGEPCVGLGDCGPGLVCGAQGSCIMLGRAQAACSDVLPCRAPLSCVEGVCQTELMSARVVQSTVPRDPDVECDGYGRALCARLEACSSFLVQGSYGDQASCVTRNAQVCVDNLALSDTVSSADGVALCAAALGSIDCGALFDHAWPEACQLAPGGRLEGQTCLADAQCQSTRCARASRGSGCGSCAPRAMAEQPCVADSDCEPGAICAADDKCRLPSALGAACDENHRCATPHVCVGGSCQRPVGAGESCDPATDSCSPYAALSCDYNTAQCSAWLPAVAGQACGYTAQGWVVCTGGATCKYEGLMGTCEAPITDGAPCTPDGPSCLAPASCIEGVCALTRGTRGDCS